MIIDKSARESDVSKNLAFQKRPCNPKMEPSNGGTWISFDSFPAGSPAEAHVTISDTSGITIVADFHGFWRNRYNISGITYDDLEMPGASSIKSPGTPMLPCLSELLEIPHDVDVSIDVLASSSNTTSGYNIRPTPPPSIPLGLGRLPLNVTNSSTLPDFFSPVYSDTNFFPGTTTGTEGELNATPLAMRGHRLMGLSFYPVQYNPSNSTLLVYSQLVIKVKYNIPAQIQPIDARLRSAAFEQLLSRIILNYDSCTVSYTQQTGTGTEVEVEDGVPDGAEYLIITNGTFETQALRLVEWKKRKGMLTAVEIINDATVQNVKDFLRDVYDNWHPVPTYVLILGDVEVIPANYDADHEAEVWTTWMHIPVTIRLFEQQQTGIIASDLGYFNMDEFGYFPNMIHSRISVDTDAQAEVVVDKILQYEQDPPDDPSFYKDMLYAGDFQDATGALLGGPDGVEDKGVPFIYTLEKLRHYLNETLGYNAHINYSCAYYDQVPVSFQEQIDQSYLVVDSLPSWVEWIWGYDSPQKWRDYMIRNITANFDDGRFLVLYYTHGGSMNMFWPVDHEHPLDGQHDRDDRDLVEGWQFPYFNASYTSELEENAETPLILSIACSTGWFDGEHDENFLDLDSLDPQEPNPFSQNANESIAENITRVAGKGAVAVIAPSRPAYGEASGHLLNAIIEAFWPGFLDPEEPRTQPIYEMGTALLFGKLYIATLDGNMWSQLYDWFVGTPDVVRTTFEEYHLFGDPETQLWTDVPSRFNVSYPVSIGTSEPQRFVVTVGDMLTGNPVNFAKVCIQQQGQRDILQVGYTNSRGQVIFDITPSSTPAHINVTVTKHNYRPHLDVIFVHQSDAKITLSQYSAEVGENIEIIFTGFDETKPIVILINDYLLVRGFYPDVPYIVDSLRSGASMYLNIWVAEIDETLPAEMYSPVTVDRVARISGMEGPDPYIYSQDDARTWDVTGNVRVWDNPDIIIRREGVVVTTMTQSDVHEIEVIVHNRGTDSTESTLVTLAYAPFGGGISWTPAGEDTVSPGPGSTDSAYFILNPPLPPSACLRASVGHNTEWPENEVDNVGYENIDVIVMTSPGEGVLQIGNPPDSPISHGYVFIKVKQQGDPDDIWNATILDYSSQAMSAGEYESVRILIDPLHEILDKEQFYKAEIFINCKLVGGMRIKALKGESTTTGPSFEQITDFLIKVGIVTVVVVVFVYILKRIKSR